MGIRRGNCQCRWSPVGEELIVSAAEESVKQEERDARAGKEQAEESASGLHTPGILYGCEKKGVAKFAIRKCMKTKEAQEV